MLLLALLLSGGCAEVEMRSAPLQPAESVPAYLSLGASVSAISSAGYERTLDQGSQWAKVGRIAGGEVFKPCGTVLTVEGRHVREAYIVVEAGRWVGFWLPYEEAYSPVKAPVEIQLHAKAKEVAAP